MGKAKKSFFKDASKVRHYKVVHRSMHDEENESPMTLQAIQPLNSSKKREDLDEDPYGWESTESHDMPQYEHQPYKKGDERDLAPIPEFNEHTSPDEIEAKLKILEGDCYFPQDGYDYEQHLKRVNKRAVIKPVEPKTASPEVGLKALEEDKKLSTRVSAAALAQNAEELAALRALDALAEEDSQAGYDEIDDDFFNELGGVVEDTQDLTMWGEKGAIFAKLNRAEEERARFREEMFAEHRAKLEEREDDEDSDSDYDFEDDEDSQVGEMTARERALEDPRLARILKEYGEDDIGELDENDVPGGTLQLEDIEDILDDYLEGKEEEAEENMIQIFGKHDQVVDRPTTEQTLAALEALPELPNLSDEEVETAPVERWDCETILTTRSNISNHPGKITLEKKKPKLQALAEVDEEEAERDSASEGEQDKENIVELPEVLLTRGKTETKEEKRLRKQAVKEHQRRCREMKKDTKLLYRAEDLKLKGKYTGTGDVRFKSRVVPMS